MKANAKVENFNDIRYQRALYVIIVLILVTMVVFSIPMQRTYRGWGVVMLYFSAGLFLASFFAIRKLTKDYFNEKVEELL